MGCCSSRNEIKGNPISPISRESQKRKSVINILAKGRSFSKASLLNSVVDNINLKRAILMSIDNLEDSLKFLRDSNTLDNKVIEDINHSALRVTKYFKGQKPGFGAYPYVDDFFPPNGESLYGKGADGRFRESDAHRLKNYMRGFRIAEEDVVWLSASEIFPSGEYSIFTNDISIYDVEQGELGNCYFMSSIAALTEIQQTIIQLFRTPKVTQNGYYEIVLKLDGEWNIVQLDDYFPCDRKTKLPIFARPNGPELWALLLEKAWAKVNGGYMNIIGGDSVEVLSTLTPFPIDRYFITEQMDTYDLWKELRKASEFRYIMTCGTGKSETLLSQGLIPSHGFTILSVKEGRVSGELIKLLHVRNPYGFKEWEGAWSDKSDLWTIEAKKVFGHVEDKDDGLFYISLQDFIQYFETVDICKAMTPLCTKTAVITKEMLGCPNIYELVIYKTSKVNISLIKKSYRFHRDIPDENDLIANIILFNVEDGKFIYLSSTHSNNNDPNLEVNLLPGSYFIFTHVIYKYSKFDKVRKVKLYITNNNYFDIIYKGKDEDYTILKNIMLSRARESLTILTQDLCQSFRNSFENTTYGYHYILNNRKTGVHAGIEDESLNYEFLYPKVLKPIDIPGRCDAIIFGFRKEYYEEFLFKLNCSVISDEETGIAKKSMFYNGGSLGSGTIYTLTHSKEQLVNEDSYTFIYKRVTYDLSNIIVVIDEKLTEINYFLNKYPAETDRLLRIPEVQDDIKKYIRDVYDFEYHSYFGEWRVKEKVIPHGRGIYKFNDGSMYIGQIKNNIFDGTGVFIFPTGDKCEITFENGVMQGVGTFVTADGQTHMVEYDKGIMVSKPNSTMNTSSLKLSTQLTLT
jgi:hypothetical protein